MKSSVLLVVLVFVICSCHDIGQDKVHQLTGSLNQKLVSVKYPGITHRPEIKKIDNSNSKLDTIPNISFDKMTIVSSGQVSSCTIIKVNGCDFDLVTRGNNTIYLATRDKKFQTPEGFKVGIRFSELPKDIQTELTKEPGWGYYYKLSSGWMLGFCEGSSCTDNYPEINSRINWIFKR
ncbi:hypothetical protein [Hymenobacter sp.]|jgi:hypothetical protein|uniref:hypothetical protein n=1 Tax=Hymenobacter sp. TaxID=1898978 RepID=UPI002EDAD792